MLFLYKKRFSVGTYNKLQQKKYSPYNIIKKIHGNAYIVNMPNNWGFCKIFNVFNIHFYCDDEQLYPNLSVDVILP